jgi:hypothetical protein
MAAIENAKTSLRRRTFLAAAFATAGLAWASNAFAGADLVDLKLVDRETGRALPVWRHRGRLFVAGEPGSRYGLRLSNHTDGRVLLVLSVDGVNILTGATAAYDQGGYVLDAYESYDVNGWRKSDTEVAAFAFAPLPQSYAARTGRPNDVGVIGMAVFKEKPAAPPLELAPPPVWRPPHRQSGRAASGWSPVAPPPLPIPPSPPHVETAGPPLAVPPAPMAMPAPAPAPAPPAPLAPSTVASLSRPTLSLQRQGEKLGTAHGAREWSVTTSVPFTRATVYPQAVQRIDYDTYANLVAQGVIPRSYDTRPRPFPLQSDGAGFVPDPPPGL